MDLKYEYIVEDLKNGQHKENVEHLFKESGVNLPQIDEKTDSRHECAKAFLIWLAVSAFGISSKSDLILCYMGLLNGYSQISKVQDRRKKLIHDSYEHYSKKSSLQKTEADLIKKANNLYKEDKPLVRDMIDYFISLDCKEESYIKACEHHLVITNANYHIRQARLPHPSFAAKYDKPIRFNLRLKNPLFCGRENVLEQIDEKLNSINERKVVVLYGMGGIGKTQIALEYVYRNQHKYSTVVWLDASDFNTLNKKCRDFLLEYSKINDLELLSNADILPTIFRKFINNRANSLIIFDNADYIDYDDEEIQNAMESLMSYIPNGNTKVIITTRNNRSFFNSDKIQINVFSPELSTTYLTSKTGIKTDEHAKILAKKLGFLPLALDYVSGYISVNQLSYLEYLELWESRGFELFDQKQANYAEKTIRQTFGITLDKLKKNKDIPCELLLELLRIFAFFSNEYLPIKEYINFAIARDNKNKELFKSLSDIDAGHCVTCLRTPPDMEKSSVKEGLVYIFPSAAQSIRIYAKYRHEAPAKTDIIEILEEPILKLLRDEIKLNEALRILKDYSLIDRNGNRISIHPMLREVIKEETPFWDWAFWQYEEYSYEDIANVYGIANDQKLAIEYKDRQNKHLEQDINPSLPFEKRKPL